MKRIILLAPDSTGGGAKKPTIEEQLADLSAQILDLHSRVETLEKTKALPAEVRLAPPVIKSTNQHFREELAELESNPEKRIALMVEGGVSENTATASVAGRIKHLRQELGIKPPAKKAAQVAARVATLIIGLLLFAFAFGANADQQGYPQNFVALTNLPPIMTGSSVSNLLSLGLTNYVAFHRGAPVGIQQQYNGVTGALTTNQVFNWTPSTDGTNPDSYITWPVYGHCSGTTNVIVTTNFPPTQTGGYKGMFLTSISNAAPTIVTNNSGLANVPQGGP